MYPLWIQAKYGFKPEEQEQERNYYEAMRLAEYHDEKGNFPIILGSKNGKYLKGCRNRTEAYEDTIVFWLREEAKSSLIFGGQGTGKTMLTTGIEIQHMSAKERFGNNFQYLDLPHVILDAAGEFSHNKFAKPLQTPRWLSRLKNYEKYFPFLRPVDISKRFVFYTPVASMRTWAERLIFGDSYIGLKATDLAGIDYQEAYQIMLELLNIKEVDPAARLVKVGCVELLSKNPDFFKVLEAMYKEEKREERRRRSKSTSKLAQTTLENLLIRGEVGIGDSPNIAEDLKNRKIMVFHFPSQATGLKLNRAMFTLYLVMMLKEVKKGAPPFSFYGEEMHKPLMEDPNSIFSRRFMDLIQLERKSGRILYSVIRMPEYAGVLINEVDYIFTPKLKANSALALDGFVPQPDIHKIIQDLKIVKTKEGKREANEWMFLSNGEGYLKFYPLPTLTEPSIQ